MDTHHIDGNHRNNAAANLVALCANCHRLMHLNFPARALHSEFAQLNFPDDVPPWYRVARLERVA